MASPTNIAFAVAHDRARALHNFLVSHKDMPYDIKIGSVEISYTSFDIKLPGSNNIIVSVMCSPLINNKSESKSEFWLGLFSNGSYLTSTKFGYQDQTVDFYTGNDVFKEIIRLADITRYDDIFDVNFK